jgi:hypothetical protein
VEEEKISAAMTASTALERKFRAKYEHNTGSCWHCCCEIRAHHQNYSEIKNDRHFLIFEQSSGGAHAEHGSATLGQTDEA